MTTQLDLPIVDTRLSHSSARLLEGCERKYWHYKVNNTPKDVDIEDDTAAFKIGTSFHYILEVSMHKKPEKMGELLEYCVQNIGLLEKDVGLVHAMVLSYLRLRKTQTLEAIACEYAIDDPNIIGYIDLIERDTVTGNWTISDLKTAKTFWATLVARLPSDRQLSLYASFYKQVAEAFNLDPDKFVGCRYKLTTKSAAEQQAKESYSEYVMRMVDKKLVKSYDIFIPKEKLHIDQTIQAHLELYQKAEYLRAGNKGRQNFSYCESYFKPCAWYSQCHGSSFTELSGSLEIVTL